MVHSAYPLDHSLPHRKLGGKSELKLLHTGEMVLAQQPVALTLLFELGYLVDQKEVYVLL